MNDPRRLRDEGDGFERTLLGSMRLDTPSDDDRRRGLAALGIAMPAAAVASISASASASASAVGGMAKPGVLGSLGSIGVGKVVAAIGLAAVGASIGVALLLPPAPVSASAVPPVPAQIALTAPGADLSRNEGPAAVKAPIADEPPLVDVASLPRVPTVRTAKAPSPIALASAEPPRPGAVLAEEIVLIDTARAALAKGDAAGALVVLEHWPAHDQGALAHEAAALRVDALVKQGDMAAATRVAQAFLAEHPKSPLAARMRSLVHLEGETSIP